LQVSLTLMDYAVWQIEGYKDVGRNAPEKYAMTFDIPLRVRM